MLMLTSCVKQSIYPFPETPVANSLESLQVDIYNFTCFAGGESLIVYDNEIPSFETYKADTYTIEWRNGEQLVGTGAELTCICGMNLRVVVKNIVTGQTGKADYKAMDCIVNEQ